MKTIKTIIAILLLTITCSSFAQIRPTRGVGTVIPGTRTTISDDKPQECIIETYDNSTEWEMNRRNYFPVTSNCTFNALAQGELQGNITINGGRVNFNSVRGAHENRIYRTLGAAYDKNFEVQFEFNISPPGQSQGVGIIPLALTSDNRYDTTYEAPTTTGMCGKYSPMDEIAILCANPIGTQNQCTLTMQMIDNGSLVPGNTTNTITLQQYNTTYYITLRIFGNEKGSLSVYTDSARNNLLRNGEICFNVPSSINGLTYLQHSTLSGAGLYRYTTAWVDNTKICKTQKTCCTISLEGGNVFCKATTNNATFTLTGSSNLANASIEVLPTDVQTSRNGNVVTVTNWGAITTAPKIITITSRVSSCECGEMKDVKTIYVYPTLNVNFDLDSSTSGNISNFKATSNFVMAGANHQWEFYLSDQNGNQGARVRDPEWRSANTVSTFNVYGLASNPLVYHTFEPPSSPYPNVLSSNYYLIKHVMNFDTGLCNENAQSLRLIFVSNSFKVTDIGDLNEPDFRNKLSNFIKSIKN